MKRLDDAWNAHDWPVVGKFHAKNVKVYWPNAMPPTEGRNNHEEEGAAFTVTFPDNKVHNDPYRIAFAQGDYTCTVTDFTGTMLGPMMLADGKKIEPTKKKFKVEFCTVAHWKDGEILEERLFYDAIGLLKQIGL